MLSRKSKDKTIKEGVVGKYVKKETPPEIPSECIIINIAVAVAPIQMRLTFDLFVLFRLLFYFIFLSSSLSLSRSHFIDPFSHKCVDY